MKVPRVETGRTPWSRASATAATRATLEERKRHRGLSLTTERVDKTALKRLAQLTTNRRAVKAHVRFTSAQRRAPPLQPPAPSVPQTLIRASISTLYFGDDQGQRLVKRTDGRKGRRVCLLRTRHERRRQRGRGRCGGKGRLCGASRCGQWQKQQAARARSLRGQMSLG